MSEKLYRATNVEHYGLCDFIKLHLYAITTPMDGTGDYKVTCGCSWVARGVSEADVQQQWAEHVSYEAKKPAIAFTQQGLYQGLRRRS